MEKFHAKNEWKFLSRLNYFLNIRNQALDVWLSPKFSMFAFVNLRFVNDIQSDFNTTFILVSQDLNQAQT